MASPDTPPKAAKRVAPQASHTTTVLLFLVILIAFFPGIFHYLWTLPLSIAPAFFIPSNPLKPTAPPITDTDTPGTAPTLAMGSWFQKQFTLPSKSKGSYLITDDVRDALPELKDYKVGILHLFIQHTSCALSLNENWDDDVRADMTDALDRVAPEAGPKGQDLYRHSAEGPDDMPAHVKSALIGASVTIPIRDGKLALGTWQGIWFLEFRAARHSRRVVATIQGQQ
ncbi:hypothetical protein N0V82_009432 [Gnomoniopsis sp. IMI 355080]|nr:hypothetical protein N0V82_009432 [Gnomoniopsis sp. IMI 355080]